MNKITTPKILLIFKTWVTSLAMTSAKPESVRISDKPLATAITNAMLKKSFAPMTIF
jgi:hypothetical protein